MNKPKPLSEGSTVGVVSPARGIPREHFDACVAAIRQLNLSPVIAPHAWTESGFYAARAEERAADLNAMFADDSIDALWCTHGGFGAERLFDHLNFELIADNPKLFIGDSNVDQLHYMIHRFAYPYTLGWCNLNTLVHMRWTESEKAAAFGTYAKAVTGTPPPWRFPLDERDPPVETLVSGCVEAPITGGCEFAYTLGTPWEVAFEGRIVVLDVSNQDAFWNKWLAQLHNAGKLQAAAGFIIVAQTFTDPPAERLRVDRSSPGGWPYLRDYLDEFITPLGKPTLLNVPMSHSRGAMPIPHGARVELDATRASLTVLESIVA